MTIITIDRAVVEQALEACEQRFQLAEQAAIIDELNNLRAALAQQEEPVQEPVYKVKVTGRWHDTEPLAPAFSLPYGEHLLYTAPPQRPTEPAQGPEGMVEFLADLQRSRTKYPKNTRMFDGLMGEIDELRRAYAGDGDIRAEAFDVAVCAFRIATEGDAGGNARLEKAESAQEPYTGDVTRIMRDAGMTFHLGLPHKAVVEQMTRVVDLVYAEASIKAAQQFAVALAQQAEGGGNLPPPLQAGPVEPVDVGLLEYRGNSVAFIHQKMTAYRAGIDAAWDAFRAKGLHPDGKTPLANMIAKYTAPPQRLPLPLKTVEKLIYENTKISPNVADDRELLGYIVNAVRAVERAHGIGETQ